MHRPLRAAFARHRELSIPTDLFFGTRTLSTTARRSAEDDAPSKPTFRQRSAAAASMLSEMTLSGNTPDSSKQGSPQATDAAPRPVDARSFRAKPSSTLDPSNAFVKPAQAGDIINVRSLPRGRGRGFRAGLRGGPSFPGTGVSDPSTSRSAFRPRGGFGDNARGGMRGRGGRASSGRGRGRGGRGRGRGGEQGEQRPRGDFSGGRDADQKLVRSEEVNEYVMALDEGVPTPFEPALELDDLLGYGPAVATATATKMGQVEGVLQNMRALGTTGGRGFSLENPNPSMVREREARGENIFFDNIADREYLADPDKMGEPSEAVKQAILRSVVQGHYPAGPEFAPANDTLGTIRSYAARGETYKIPDGPSVEAKVAELLPKAKAAAPKQPRA